MEELHKDFAEKCHIKYRIRYRYSWACYFKRKFRLFLFNVFGYRYAPTEEEVPLL